MLIPRLQRITHALRGLVCGDTPVGRSHRSEPHTGITRVPGPGCVGDSGSARQRLLPLGVDRPSMLRACLHARVIPLGRPFGLEHPGASRWRSFDGRVPLLPGFRASTAISASCWYSVSSCFRRQPLKRPGLLSGALCRFFGAACICPGQVNCPGRFELDQGNSGGFVGESVRSLGFEFRHLPGRVHARAAGDGSRCKRSERPPPPAPPARHRPGQRPGSWSLANSYSHTFVSTRGHASTYVVDGHNVG